ncbi:MAG: type IV secretion system protein [Alphaproteobacteria bacterium]|nr:type IV secretion system protein [Alphaproteobacteria bacterium]
MVQENQKALSSQEQLKNERYLWIARAFSVMAVLSILANIFLLVAIGSLVPLVRVRPYFMTVLDKNQQVVEITPPRADQLNNQEILESLIRQYVLARYTITSDVSEVEERWGPKGIVSLMSSQGVYDAFMTRHYDKLMPNIKTEGLIANVKIESVTPQNENSSWWNVNFKWLRQDQTSVEPEVFDMSDQLEVRFDPLYNQANISTWQDRLKNPLGFRVLNYGTRKK